MERTAITMQSTLRSLRIFHSALLLSVLLYALLIRLIPAHATQSPSPLILTAGGALTAMVLGVGFLARLTYVRPALENLRANSENAGALVRWRLGSILSAVLAESAALLGVVIHFLGGPNAQSAILIFAGAVVMVLWWPREP